MTHYPANFVLPALEVGWGLSTFGLAWAQNVEKHVGIRQGPGREEASLDQC